jgi:hypothetical protein
MRAVSGRSQSLEVFTMAASLAALLRRDILPSRDVLAELDGYRFPGAGKATSPRSRRRLRARLACERGQATVAGLGSALVGSVFVGAVLYSVLVPTLSRVLAVYS